MLRRYTASLFAKTSSTPIAPYHNSHRTETDHPEKTIHALKNEVKTLELKLHHARKKIHDMNNLVQEHKPGIFNPSLQKLIDEELKEHQQNSEHEHKLLIESKMAILQVKKEYLNTLEAEKYNASTTIKLLDEEIKHHRRDIKELSEEITILHMTDSAEEAKHTMENPALKEFALRPNR